MDVPKETPKETPKEKTSTLRVKRMHIDTLQQPIIYMHRQCHVCRSEGFNALSRMRVTLVSNTSEDSSGAKETQVSRNGTIIATLNVVDNEEVLTANEVGLSEAAWRLLGANEGDDVAISHPAALDSLSYVRAKIYGKTLCKEHMQAIVKDIGAGRYSDVHLAAFVTACVGKRLTQPEIIQLTQAMTDVGDRLSWSQEIVVDKHCAGGLPGNRTTPIVVALMAACGLTMPKTSSRAITSPAGTADTMETLAPVELSLEQMRAVVEHEGGCVVWGGSANLSPIDDILIRVLRALDLDSEGQLVASVLSKKLAAGSTHLLMDLPVGPTAKIRSEDTAERVAEILQAVGQKVGIVVDTVVSDGSQPVGAGIGPALEARDVLAVLQNHRAAPSDLRHRALLLAGKLLELCGKCEPGRGGPLAEQTLSSGAAWRKFQAICEAQGGMREPPEASHHYEVYATRSGLITYIDNRALARIAKFAGAPAAKAAGVKLDCQLGQVVEKGDRLFTIYSESPGELEYALNFHASHVDLINVADEIL